MTALMDFNLSALIDVAVKRLIRLVGTVGDFVANELIIDALSIVACKLPCRACAVLLLAVDLVGVITAVVFAVFKLKWN